jgi:hypothetical protein
MQARLVQCIRFRFISRLFPSCCFNPTAVTHMIRFVWDQDWQPGEQFVPICSSLRCALNPPTSTKADALKQHTRTDLTDSFPVSDNPAGGGVESFRMESFRKESFIMESFRRNLSENTLKTQLESFIVESFRRNLSENIFIKTGIFQKESFRNDFLIPLESFRRESFRIISAKPESFRMESFRKYVLAKPESFRMESFRKNLSENMF